MLTEVAYTIHEHGTTTNVVHELHPYSNVLTYEDLNVKLSLNGNLLPLLVSLVILAVASVLHLEMYATLSARGQVPFSENHVQLAGLLFVAIILLSLSRLQRYLGTAGYIVLGICVCLQLLFTLGFAAPTAMGDWAYDYPDAIPYEDMLGYVGGTFKIWMSAILAVIITFVASAIARKVIARKETADSSAAR